MINQQLLLRSYKSIAVALIFSVLLGPVGLLYASLWGGVTMIVLGIIVISSKLKFCTLMIWIISCVWAVKAVESHNKTIYQTLVETTSAA